MTDKNSPDPSEFKSQKITELNRPDSQQFTASINELLKRAESIRLNCMKKQRVRNNIILSLSLISLISGAIGFGWFLLMKADIIRAIGSITLAIIMPIALNLISTSSLKEYRRIYKEEFLPDLAKALGGFHFSPTRGISPKITSQTGILPSHTTYNAEDCFIGNYKDVKVIFSEARIQNEKKKSEQTFKGLFVLLEMPNTLIEGHTIITTDKPMYDKWRNTRWKKFQDIENPSKNKEHSHFRIISNNPEAAQLLTGERLLKELSEVANIFEQAPISAAIFQKKLIFIAIPYAKNMFEPSNIHMPISTHRHILQCRREIDQILEIIDIFDLYNPESL